MNELQVFNNEEFGQVRTTEIDGKVYFCGRDIAKALGYKRPQDAIRANCRYAVSNRTPHPQAPDKTIDMLFIPEGDVYRLIVRSKLPTAEKFETWVFDDVLPSIRKTGGYIPVTENDNNETILSKALLIMQNTLNEKEMLLSQRTRALDIAQPKADKYDKLMNANGAVSFNVAAKQLGTGRNRFMKLLRERGILFRDGLSNIAYQAYCERGYFTVRYSTGKNGFACGVTKVTPKGLDWLCDVLNESA